MKKSAAQKYAKKNKISFKTVKLGYGIIINMLAFILFGVDKRRAQKGKWRISEKTLIGIAVVGGSLGAFLGMHGFCHKTKHWKFRVLVPLFLVLQVTCFLLF